MLIHAKTNRDAAIETHATSIKRACPATRARMAPTAAINRATPATTSAIQLKILFIRTFALNCAWRSTANASGLAAR
jgi:LmbE family N-acetylglucosaminyl deacetylase